VRKVTRAQKNNVHAPFLMDKRACTFYCLFMLNTTQTTLSPADLISTSRGLGRYAARTTIGTSPYVIQRALDKARVQLPSVDSNAFVAGWNDEREALRYDGYRAALQ
jgi:hypothetical protein